MRFSVLHAGIPVGYVDLSSGELVAGRLSPLPGLDAIRDTIRSGSDALLSLGFFGAAAVEGQNGLGKSLRAAADLRFDLLDDRGDLSPTTFVNVLEAPDGGLVVLARHGHAHATIAAALPTKHTSDSGAEDEVADRGVDEH